MLIPFGVFSAAGAGGGGSAGAYELISTTTLGSDTSSVTFSSIVSTYKQIQIRYAARTDYGNSFDQIYMRMNADTGANYRDHYLTGTGSAVNSGTSGANGITLGWLAGNTATSDAFGAGIVDVLDYVSSSKYTTSRTLAGSNNGATNRVYLQSGLWLNTAAITSLTLLPVYGSNFKTGSRFSLYGIKG